MKCEHRKVVIDEGRDAMVNEAFAFFGCIDCGKFGKALIDDLYAQIRELKQENEACWRSHCQKCYDEQSRRNWEEAEG